MECNLFGRHFLKLMDFSPEEIRWLLELSSVLKRAKQAGSEEPRLRGKNIVLIFEKESTRTRCAFETACFDQGSPHHFFGTLRVSIGGKRVVKGHGSGAWTDV